MSNNGKKSKMTWGEFYKLMGEAFGWKEDSEYGPEEEIEKPKTKESE